MKVRIPTPVKVIEQINHNISKYYSFLKPKQISKLLNKGIDLYMYILIENSNDYNRGFYTDISARDIESVTGKPIINKQRIYYTDIINLLDGVIEIDNKYSTGSFSKSYRISKSIHNYTNLISIEFDITKIFKSYSTIEYWKTKYPKHHKHIDKLYNTQIQLEKSIQFMYDHEGMSLKDKARKNDNSGEMVTGRTLDSEKIISYTVNILKFYFNNRWVKISKEGRFYSSLTNLPSILRRFLRVDGRKVVEVDVVASQPTLFSTLIDHKKFNNDIQIGSVYTKMGNGDRNKGKYIMFSKILFNKNQIKKHSKYYNLIEKNYPGLTELINDEKEKYNGELWKKLQIMESEIFVNILGNETKILGTIHDSILVFPEDELEVKEYIESIYMEMFNIRVNLK